VVRALLPKPAWASQAPTHFVPPWRAPVRDKRFGRDRIPEQISLVSNEEQARLLNDPAMPIRKTDPAPQPRQSGDDTR
jgi:hypothetical protein